MKDFTKEQLEEGRPNFEALYLINFALSHIYDDNKHTIQDTLTSGPKLRKTFGYTYEELIGTLLVARDTIERYEKESQDCGEYKA
jgi:hypothetical protein